MPHVDEVAAERPVASPDLYCRIACDEKPLPILRAMLWEIDFVFKRLPLLLPLVAAIAFVPAFAQSPVPAQPWSQAQVQDFGESGKVLLDLDDNRFLVPDVEALPPKEQELFLRYVYW